MGTIVVFCWYWGNVVIQLNVVVLNEMINKFHLSFSLFSSQLSPN